MVQNVLLPLLIFIYSLCIGVLFLYGLNCYVMMYLFVRARRREQEEERLLVERFRHGQAKRDWPMVTVQLPVYNERFVVERLVRAVCAFEYPNERLEIQVLDDSTDDSVEVAARIISQMRARGYNIRHIRRVRRTGFKAGALAYGMRQASGEYFAIFDADFVPPPDFLRRTVPFLVEDPGCGFVQARWGHRNADFSMLTRAQAIGVDGHFVVEQSARAWNNLFLNFNGTAGVWRRQAIEDAGGWQDDTICEDLDLSYRAQLAGWRGRFLFDVVVPAELPTNINALKSQQYRWAKGSIQAARKLLPRVLRKSGISSFKKLQAVLHLSHYMVHPIIFIMILSSLPMLILARDAFRSVWALPLVGMMLVSLVAPSVLYFFSQRLTRADWKRRIVVLPFLMIVGLGLAVSNTLGVIGALIGKKKDEFIRTPKLGLLAEVHSVSRNEASLVSSWLHSSHIQEYRIPLRGTFFLELFLGIWALLAFAQYLAWYKFIIGPIFLLHGVGFLFIAITSLVHEGRFRRGLMGRK